ncbi:GH39 family glycosyl hydrolase [Cerasicoccus frondis]|uniref:GH39 family glycosyl hydrolase n=1 Tax=Cerasicoccus frondis TaxID=490090 RepID=UPI002852D041|nr:hypothetical protein [Cerasicoccus frondis]
MKRNCQFYTLIIIGAWLVQVCSASQSVLLSSLNRVSDIKTAAWQIEGLSVDAVEGGPEDFHVGCLQLSGYSNFGGAKGDLTVNAKVPEGISALRFNARSLQNVKRIGVQITDAEGEVLFSMLPVISDEWEVLSFDIKEAKFVPAYAQENKNGQLDVPLKRVNVVWFTEDAGEVELEINCLVATLIDVDDSRALKFDLGLQAAVEFGSQAFGQVVVSNYTDEPYDLVLNYEMQLDSRLLAPPAPLGDLGIDQASGKRSWTMNGLENVSEGTLTDGDHSTNYSFKWGANLTEATQFIDFGEAIKVETLRIYASDANWVFNADIEASVDGVNYMPIDGFADMDWHGRWGEFFIHANEPVEASMLRIRYHRNGEKMEALRLPYEIAVYNGVADEPLEFPQIGKATDAGSIRATIPAGSFKIVTLSTKQPLKSGCYLVSIMNADAEVRWIDWGNLLVLPAPLESISPNSPFGLNGSLTELAGINRELGIGWMRFENLKWPMVYLGDSKYNFTGKVTPWRVNVDNYVKSYRDVGISVLPYLFETPEVESTGRGQEKNVLHYPPQDYQKYAEFVFQTVARYGSRKHPEDVLLTEDKVSGLGWMNTYELWNEPNLDAPAWGHWVGSMDEYMKMFVLGAKAVKRADPTARVANGGLAGTELSLVDQFRTYVHDDGTTPLDYIDVLSVHHYTGPIAPEIATVNTNIQRDGSTKGLMTFEDNLKALIGWKKLYKPGLEIWMTETGYDTGGPHAVSYRKHAAFTPRNILTTLGYGIDKVLVYREKGSTPSLYLSSGMLDNDFAVRPAFLTYATLIRVMDGAEFFIRLPHDDENARCYGAVVAGEPVIAAWAIEGEVRLGSELGEGEVIDAFGHVLKQEIGADFPLTIFPTYFKCIDRDAVKEWFAQGRAFAQQVTREEERLSQLRTYLFDFGDNGAGSIQMGAYRPFSPVVADTLFHTNDRYGFSHADSNRSNSDYKWIPDPLDSDSVKLLPDSKFLFRAEPGRYELTIRCVPIGEASTIEISGLVGTNLTKQYSKSDDLFVVDVQVGNEPVEISLSKGYAQIYWLSLIETNPSASL